MLIQTHVFNIIINPSAEVLLLFSSISFLLLPEEGPQRKQSEKVSRQCPEAVDVLRSQNYKELYGQP